ncbi:hypothetical protein B0O99DRAFT_690703 [Bisporella sp. PMI_857]|nr:hypothetical protein B0O99DRAFT_690703 [Bisporella sp. PMI_857]
MDTDLDVILFEAKIQEITLEEMVQLIICLHDYNQKRVVRENNNNKVGQFQDQPMSSVTDGTFITPKDENILKLYPAALHIQNSFSTPADCDQAYSNQYASAYPASPNSYHYAGYPQYPEYPDPESIYSDASSISFYGNQFSASLSYSPHQHTTLQPRLDNRSENVQSYSDLRFDAQQPVSAVQYGIAQPFDFNHAAAASQVTAPMNPFSHRTRVNRKRRLSETTTLPPIPPGMARSARGVIYDPAVERPCAKNAFKIEPLWTFIKKNNGTTSTLERCSLLHQQLGCSEYSYGEALHMGNNDLRGGN